MKDNKQEIIMLVAGSFIIFNLLTKSKTKSKTSTLENNKTETSKTEVSKNDEVYDVQKENESEESNFDEKDEAENLSDPSDNNVNPNAGFFVPNPSKSSSSYNVGFIPNPSKNQQTSNPKFQITPGVYTPPTKPLNKPNSVGGVKQNQVSGIQKIIIKSKPTPGYFYRPTKNDNAYSDPLLKIAVSAYNLYNIPDNVILTYSRQINKAPYNIRFQHRTSPNYLPYNKQVDTSMVYGTVEEQFNNPEQGSIREGWEYPVIYLPLEEEFF